VEADQLPRQAERIAQAGEQFVGDVLHRGAGGVHHRVGRGEVQRGEIARAQAHGVGGEHEVQPPLRVQPEAQAQGIGPRDDRSGHVEDAAAVAPGRRPHAQAGQGEGLAADEVDAEDVGARLDARVVVAELDGQAGREPRVAARAAVDAQREREHRRAAEAEAHRVAHARAAEQGREVFEPVGAAGVAGEDAAHPVGQRHRAAGGQRGDREIGHGVAAAQAEQAGHGHQRRVGQRGIGLRLDQRHHQVEQRIVEFVGAVGRHAHVARRGGARQLQPGERQAEGRALRIRCRGGQVDFEPDAAEPRLASCSDKIAFHRQQR
ncbi:MAG TPA: hypothetical protein DCQ29_02260, partial [Chitinophagaceae bacterium]|nr:hypothetical protein [Chitinophagaceae bacterium]